MKITALVENTSINNNIACEHGLSLYIETETHRILFDMGQTDLFYQNSKMLNIDLSQVDIAVVSHGHYDHGGGLKRFLEINSKAPVYINEFAFEPHYNGTDKYIGLDISLQDNKRLIRTSRYKQIDDNLSLYTCNELKCNYPLSSGGLMKKVNNKFIDDDFLHEQYLLIKEGDKNILISGCSHKGILNITDWFDADYIIGGFHFSKLPIDDKLKEYADLLGKKKSIFYTCHCTGVEQYDFMKKHMNNLYYLSSGETIDTKVI